MLTLLQVPVLPDAVSYFERHTVDTVSIDAERRVIHLFGDDRVVAVGFEDVPALCRSGVLPTFISMYLRTKHLA